MLNKFGDFQLAFYALSQSMPWLNVNLYKYSEVMYILSRAQYREKSQRVTLYQLYTCILKGDFSEGE